MGTPAGVDDLQGSVEEIEAESGGAEYRARFDSADADEEDAGPPSRTFETREAALRWLVRKNAEHRDDLDLDPPGFNLPESGERQGFRIHGGQCLIRPDADITDGPGVIDLQQTVLRHLHLLGWLGSIGLILFAFYMVLTGTTYERYPGANIHWSVILLMGLVLPASIPGRWLYDRLRGYTWAKRIALESVESVTAEIISTRGWFKRRRLVPSFVVRYRDGESRRRRRIRLRPYYDEEELRKGIQLWEELGCSVIGKGEVLKQVQAGEEVGSG